MYYYNGAQRYEQFLQVGRLYRALILLGNQISAFNTVLTRVTYGRLRRVTNVSYRSVPGVYFIQACVSYAERI